MSANNFSTNNLEQDTANLMQAVLALDDRVPDIDAMVADLQNMVDELMLHAHQNEKNKVERISEEDLVNLKNFYEHSVESFVLLKDFLSQDKETKKHLPNFLDRKSKITNLLQCLKAEVLFVQVFGKKMHDIVTSALKQLEEDDSDSMDEAT